MDFNDHISRVRNASIVQNILELRALIALINYYSKFVQIYNFCSKNGSTLQIITKYTKSYNYVGINIAKKLIMQSKQTLPRAKYCLL